MWLHARAKDQEMGEGIASKKSKEGLYPSSCQMLMYI